MKSWQLATATVVSTFCVNYVTLANSDVPLTLRAVSSLLAAAMNAGISASFLARKASR